MGQNQEVYATNQDGQDILIHYKIENGFLIVKIPLSEKPLDIKILRKKK